jgi:hypothetical protein
LSVLNLADNVAPHDVEHVFVKPFLLEMNFNSLPHIGHVGIAVKLLAIRYFSSDVITYYILL